MSSETKKPTKMETLTAQLAKAKAELEATQARLQPQLDAERERAHQLRVAYDKAQKVRRAAYETREETRRAVARRLFPEAIQARLRAAMRARVAHLPHANVVRIADEYQGAAIKADPAMVAAEAAYRTAERHAEEAQRVYWRATGPASPLSRLEEQLDSKRDAVRRLEREISRLPLRREAERERRAQERADELVAEQTEAARELLAGFKLEDEEQVEEVAP